MLARSDLDVLVVRGAITQAQVQSHRPSYVNALLIRSRDGRALCLAANVLLAQLRRSMGPYDRSRSAGAWWATSVAAVAIASDGIIDRRAPSRAR